MKYCEDYAALLDLYVDGELQAEDLIRVQSHLDECPACQSYVDAALAIRAAFPDVEDTVVPDGFADRIMARVQTAPRRKKTTPWTKVLMPLAACCAIMILLQNSSIFSGRTEEPRKTEAPAAAMDAATPAYAAETTTESAKEYARTEEALPECQDAPAERNTTQSMAKSVSDMAVYQTLLQVPGEAAELLADHTPVLETETEVHYHLSMSDCAQLQARLEEAQILYAAEEGIDSTVGYVLVILFK